MNILKIESLKDAKKEKVKLKKEIKDKPSPRELFNRERMVVNGAGSKSDDHLDIPTFLRRQMD